MNGKILALFTFAAFTTFSAPSSAQSALVGSCATTLRPVPPRFTTIKAAIAGATGGPAGPIIYLCPGAYPEQLTIGRSLTLTGLPYVPATAGPFTSATLRAVLTPPSGGLLKNITALNGESLAAQIAVVGRPAPQAEITVSVRNFVVDGTGNGIADCGLDLQGIAYQNASGAVDSMVVKNQSLSADLRSCASGGGIFAEAIQTAARTATRTITINNNSVFSYQKNGIAANLGVTATIQNNRVKGQGLTALIPQNGIQIVGGAAGTVSGNLVTDQVFAIPPFLSNPPAAAGILIFASPGIQITNNTILNSQFPVALMTNRNAPVLGGAGGRFVGTSDNSVVTNNTIADSPYGDGIDVCSDTNTITGNKISETFASGIHFDLRCDRTVPARQGNTVTGNTIQDTCTGFLLGTPATALTGNAISGNTGINLESETAIGDTCVPAFPAAAAARSIAAGTVTTDAMPSPR